MPTMATDLFISYSLSNELVRAARALIAGLLPIADGPNSLLSCLTADKGHASSTNPEEGPPHAVHRAPLAWVHAPHATASPPGLSTRPSSQSSVDKSSTPPICATCHRHFTAGDYLSSEPEEQQQP
ncbi:hypothetical protein Agub_g6629, partial [Astrephomene gubernaculifera]